jgi:hypothetical protein
MTNIAAGLAAIFNCLQAGRPLAEIDWERYLMEAISCLTLTIPPLPDEIAELINRADDGAVNTDCAIDRKLFANLGDALRVLAQENARHRLIHESDQTCIRDCLKRVVELEAERDYWRNTRQDAISADILKLKAERDDLVAQLHIALASVGHNKGIADRKGSRASHPRSEGGQS